MLNFVRQFFLPQVSEDDEAKALEARMFKSFSLITIGFVALIGIVGSIVLVKKTAALLVVLTLIVLVIISQILARRERIRLASAVLVYGLWFVSTVQIWLSGGVNTVMVASYIAIMPVAGGLLGPRAVIAIAVLSLAATLGMTVLPTIGYSLPTYYPIPPWSAWLLLMFWFTLAVPSINTATRDFVIALGRARKQMDQRKKAEDALRESEKKYRLLSERIPCVVYSALPDELSTSLYVSGRIEELTGYSAREFLNDPALYRSIIHPDDAIHVWDKIEEQRRQRNVLDEEYRIVTKAGDVKWIRARANPTLDEHGEIASTVGFMEDITERRRAEEELLKEKNFSALVLDSLPGTFYLFDSQGKLLRWNRFLERASGYSSEEIGSRHVLDFFPDDEKTKLQQAVDEVFTKGETYVEAEWVTRAGKRIPYYFRARQIYVDGSPCLIGVGIDITGRKRIESALEESEKKYRNIFENAVEGIFRTSPDGRLISANPAFARAIGYASPAEMINEVTDIGSQLYVRPEDREAFKRYLEEEPGPLEGVEAEFRRKDGTNIWVSINARAVRDQRGNIIYYEGTCEDITARKLAQDRVRESEERYRLLAENSLVGVYIHRDEYFIYTNRRLREMLGYTSEEMMQKKFWEIVHPEQREEVRARGLARYQGLELPPEYEFKAICRNGETKWLEVSAVRVAHQGRVAVLGAFVDITEKKLATDALTKSEALMQAILNGITTNIAFVNKDLEIMWANKSAADSVSRLPSQMIGRKCHDLWADPGKPCEGCPTVIAFRTRTSHHVEMVTPDGRVWDERSEPVFDANGQLLGVVEIAQDVTEQKKADQERESLRAQLFQSQKMEAVGTLAGGIAHDFNNLLTVVLGFADLLLLEKDQDHPDYADLHKIRHAASNGADLVQRLLTLGRKTEPKPTPMNLNRQVSRVGKLLRRTIPKMIDLKTHLSDDLPEICADASLIEQVLMNLAVNARDAMPDGGSLILATQKVLLDDEYCRLHVGAKPGEYALLTVSDTGCGMDKETLGHIFEPFFTTKEMGRGTGLGLAMVYGIVNQHNGHIICYSEVGRGTAFKVYLPAIPTEEKMEEDTSGRVLALGSETVLLVDDEEFVRELGARILTRFGYSVLQAADGKEALDVIEREGNRISLVILDLIMPRMGGKQCLAEILKIDPHMKVIVSSGYSADSARECTGMGAQGFVDKPFRVKELLHEVRKALDQL